ncbi:MAG TPA: ATP-binding protein [Streptosporangiaceae bacterium]|nr:ATP-binding protein [Streptosporangiaceae bacterium]
MSHRNELTTWPGDRGACTLAADDGFLTALALWARAFPGTPEQVSVARGFMAHLLDGSPFYDDAVGVLSELFTNAVLHTASGQPGGLVIVQVTRWRHGVRIAVTDQGSSAEPVIRDPASASVGGPAESGRGLYLVAHLAQCLGWHDDASGRTVAAVLGQRLPRPSGPPPAQPGEASIPVGVIESAGG